LKRLAHGEPDQLLRDWAATALYANTLIKGGEKLTAFYSFRKDEPLKVEVTDEVLSSLDPETREALALALAETLTEWDISAETVCKAVLGSEYSPEAAESYEAGDWSWEAAELPGLWRLYESEHARHNDVVSAPRFVAYLVGGKMASTGERVLELRDRAKLLLTEEQAHAVMLSDSEVQKLQRYEAHLERVLYRALHELEAMKEKRSGGQAPLARFEIHGSEQ
jgi:hypothetical protein